MKTNHFFSFPERKHFDKAIVHETDELVDF